MSDGINLSISGTERLTSTARAMRDAKVKEAVGLALRQSARPLGEAAKASALATLPRRGGLAAAVAGSSITFTPTVKGDAVGVRITPTGSYDSRSIDAGRLKHPVYGHPVWVEQQVKPGWFTRPMNAAEPRVRAALTAALKAVAERIVRAR